MPKKSLLEEAMEISGTKGDVVVAVEDGVLHVLIVLQFQEVSASLGKVCKFLQNICVCFSKLSHSQAVQSL